MPWSWSWPCPWDQVIGLGLSLGSGDLDYISVCNCLHSNKNTRCSFSVSSGVFVVHNTNDFFVRLALIISFSTGSIFGCDTGFCCVILCYFIKCQCIARLYFCCRGWGSTPAHSGWPLNEIQKVLWGRLWPHCLLPYTCYMCIHTPSIWPPGDCPRLRFMLNVWLCVRYKFSYY